jgi:hypothetical protein
MKALMTHVMHDPDGILHVDVVESINAIRRRYIKWTQASSALDRVLGKGVNTPFTVNKQYENRHRWATRDELSFIRRDIDQDWRLEDSDLPGDINENAD